jgi:hypothetical protein
MEAAPSSETLYGVIEYSASSGKGFGIWVEEQDIVTKVSPGYTQSPTEYRCHLETGNDRVHPHSSEIITH